MTEAIRVVIADDHPMWIEGLSRDLSAAGMEIVATAADGHSAVNRTRATSPDVLVLDLNLPKLRGDQVCAELQDLDSHILILSASGEPADVLAAVKAGATGYLVKSASAAEIVTAVRDTAQGIAVFTPGLAGLVLGEFNRLAADTGGTDAAPELTARETEILRFVAVGMSYKDIAAELFISHRTVQNHVQNILGKLHMHNRVELTRYAISRGLDGADTRAQPGR